MRFCVRRLPLKRQQSALLAVYTGIVANRSSGGALPVILLLGGRDEPAHVHAEREEGKAKFWLEPVRLENSRGFGRVEIGRIQRLVEENESLLLRSWHEYFGN